MAVPRWFFNGFLRAQRKNQVTTAPRWWMIAGSRYCCHCECCQRWWRSCWRRAFVGAPHLLPTHQVDRKNPSTPPSLDTARWFLGHAGMSFDGVLRGSIQHSTAMMKKQQHPCKYHRARAGCPTFPYAGYWFRGNCLLRGWLPACVTAGTASA